MRSSTGRYVTLRSRALRSRQPDVSKCFVATTTLAGTVGGRPLMSNSMWIIESSFRSAARTIFRTW